ncbi:maltose ABC transporter permease [Vallitalea longa]|uniref:Maltose ABC transporter permease n=1 Tax=Vallitalea longa TaxID=2936439 RepID=A0A9W5YHM7_9FIRM|nr:ABC transporter permease subunit [Vallitalea longa]GKX32094.1 maltose ABC transporter permease [Vallitalea longa]
MKTMTAKIPKNKLEKRNKRKLVWKRIKKYKILYLFLLPAITFYFVFGYIPMYGVTLAFKDFRFDTGILMSPWVGLKYVKKFFDYFQFELLIRNSFVISFLKLIIGFPAPIILALMLNEVRINKFKRVIQTVTYLPYFVSWVVVATIFSKFLSPHQGLFNDLRMAMGEEPIFFLGFAKWFYIVIISSDIWKNIGFNSIIYLAALSSIDPMLYEASAIDGAGKWKRLIHITLPAIMPTVGILFILSMSGLLKAGYEQIILFQQPPTIPVSEVLETYSVKVGLQQGQYSYATVVGLFQSIVSLILIVVTNKIAKKVSNTSLW